MARRRFRNSQRFESPTERSFQEYILNTPAPITTRSELLRLIRGGEDTYLELKVKLSNPERIAQGIVALANTDGGTVIFGVSDQLRVEGVSNPEGVQEEIVRICREEIVPPVIPLIDVISFDNGRRVVALDIDGKRRPYRTRDGRYVRIGAENARSAATNCRAGSTNSVRSVTRTFRSAVFRKAISTTRSCGVSLTRLRSTRLAEINIKRASF
ncbi:MAG: ATP-binding protein [Acidobacteria bacterium]|nr:ATP-binding protein [Acidobacteriota bacterium]